MSDNQRIDVYLVCNAKYHDTNFARLELLKLLAEHEDVWVRVADSYADVDAISASKRAISGRAPSRMASTWCGCIGRRSCG